MGDNFLRQQVNNFKRRREQAAVALGRPTLFDRPDLVHTVYTVKPLDGQCLAVDDVLFAVPSKLNGHIDVAAGHRKVACIDGDAAQALREALHGGDGPEVVRVRVIEVSPVSRVAKARIIEE